MTTNNLKNVNVQFPLSALVCVTGVSGSGKSSLLDETLARALVRRLGGIAARPGPHTSLRGVSQIDKVVQIDQSPIGRTPRSNPATYTGVFDEIRKVFANTRDARGRGYKAGRFSFNVKGGRCEECQGQGQRRIEMNFLPDLYVACPVCEGKRFNRQTLEIRYRDRSIADVLDMRVEEAAEFFENFPAIARLVGSLHEVGLGYMTLGQSSTTLSGGEAQRIKLATELSRVDTGKTVYILDEPTTGLHFDDIRKLLAVLGRLVDLGNTVLVIEHNLDVIKSADWIIDLGPEGGDGGGQVVATGTPEEIAAIETTTPAGSSRRCFRAPPLRRQAEIVSFKLKLCRLAGVLARRVRTGICPIFTACKPAKHDKPRRWSGFGSTRRQRCETSSTFPRRVTSESPPPPSIRGEVESSPWRTGLDPVAVLEY